MLGKVVSRCAVIVPPEKPISKGHPPSKDKINPQVQRVITGKNSRGNKGTSRLPRDQSEVQQLELYSKQTRAGLARGGSQLARVETGDQAEPASGLGP